MVPLATVKVHPAEIVVNTLEGMRVGLYDPYGIRGYLKLLLCCPKSRTSTR